MGPKSADYQTRLRGLVELEYERFLKDRFLNRGQKSIDSFAIEKTKADTEPFLNVLSETEVILMLGGRVKDADDELLMRLIGLDTR